MLIKPYRQSRLKLTGLDRPVRRQHGRTTGCAAIRYIYELNSRETHSRHQGIGIPRGRSEEHTSELQSLMRISYAVFCLKNKKTEDKHRNNKQEMDQETEPGTR